MTEYGFTQQKSTAIATAIHYWGVQSASRGYTTEKDMNKTFRAVFGVGYTEALTAIQDLTAGDVSQMGDLTERSASALGLKPAQAQKFMKGMYRQSLRQYGFDVDSLHW